MVFLIRCINKINWLLRKQSVKKLKREILNYYSKYPPENHEIQKAVEHIKKNALCFLYPANPLTKQYDPNDIVVYKDSQTGLHYVMHENKKLFFKRSCNIKNIKRSYSDLITEQDKESPHRYTNSSFEVERGNVLFDIGSAEGFFALDNIEKADTIVLFENNPEWIEALTATFEPWKKKVVIVPKFVSHRNDKENVSIDTFLLDKKYSPNFIKIDVEGAETQVLLGMQVLLRTTSSLKIALASYHLPYDHELFTTMLLDKGFQLTSSKGMMLIRYNEKFFPFQPPYFRKGIIRARKNFNKK